MTGRADLEKELLAYLAADPDGMTERPERVALRVAQVDEPLRVDEFAHPIPFRSHERFTGRA